MKKFLFMMVLVGFSFTAQAAKVPGPLVDSNWVEKNLRDIVILDIRQDVKSFTAKPQIAVDKKTKKKSIVRVGGHIPGAVLVDYKKIRSKQKINGLEIDKMLLGKAAMEKLMQSNGVDQDSTVVVVSPGENDGDITGATRLYWQLKYYGHDNMAILDGGVAQWLLDGHKVSIARSNPREGNWKTTAERKEILATSDDVARAVKDRSVQLMDNRPLSQYLGATYKKSYVYAAGHIPGAKSFPTELITDAGKPAKFSSSAKLADLSRAMGIDTNKTTITYCNSGHLATGGWFYLHEVLGNKNVKMYDGSMHEWTKEKRPVVSMKME